MDVLIADDDSVARRMLEKLLVGWGFDVTAAEDGSQAFDLLKRPGSPRLVLLDWQMPGLSGVEICRRMPRSHDGVPFYVILITSRTEKADIVVGLHAGASDYIAKPFDIEELRARVQVGRRVIELHADLAARIHQLEVAHSHIKVLQGILPICMFCHSIRSDEESWERLEKYLTEHTEAKLSHGLCPDCRDEHYPKV